MTASRRETDRIKAILYTTLLYTGIFSLLNWSLAYLLINFLSCLVLSAGYFAGKKSIVVTMIAQGIFSILSVLAMLGIIGL